MSNTFQISHSVYTHLGYALNLLPRGNRGYRVATSVAGIQTYIYYDGSYTVSIGDRNVELAVTNKTT